MNLDAPEYSHRLSTDFTPLPTSLKPGELYAAVPKHLFERSTITSSRYILRHLSFALVFAWGAYHIEEVAGYFGGGYWVERALWGTYWFWQSIIFTGFWVLGHEAGHDALSPSHAVNEVIGVILHTFLLTPYHAWRLTHRTHHKKTNHMNHDETHLPWRRSDWTGLPPEKEATEHDYKDLVEETPAFTLFRLVIRQFIGFQMYILNNRKGNPKYYGKFTSHYDPDAKLFKPKDRTQIIFSDICILSMIALLTYWDPTVPYYRDKEWTFLRGALGTVDRPMFGWIGRFFWFGVAHDHVAHHIFHAIPFYNLPEVTEAIKPILGEYYLYDSTPTLYALWRSFTQCQFVEDEGGVVFYKNQQGRAQVRVSPEVHSGLEPSKTNGYVEVANATDDHTDEIGHIEKDYSEVEL
ncbi:hypothetical protein EUX98_g2804 [Antrodiella citrinella]|uniref:Fatty acid desaturase domain-containing protein n=1 Tax=Antrodiella citrinella TaxID=2447956 RepID=A0A4S4N6C5_9APHY|nr:hypothetical protein EUX98_g2804 [Antrodiella citrinella]